MATANPAMQPQVYDRAGRSETFDQAMTIAGTVQKTALLVLVVLAGGAFTWWLAGEVGAPAASGMLVVGALGGFIMALVTVFKPSFAPFTAPIYAGFEGLFLGGLTYVVEHLAQGQYQGLALQAAWLSGGVLGLMLFLYGTGIIRATEKVKMGIVAATGAICLVYLVNMVMSFFGAQIPYLFGSGPIGIGFSVVVVVIAALNLVLDFDFIQQGVAHQAPKFMEWYGAFSLLVTLVWMYIEILRLLMKIRDGSRG